MSSLFWPGDDRAASIMTEAALLDAMVAVESAWLAALVDVGLAPAGTTTDLTRAVTAADLPAIGADSEAGGNPVIPLVALLRSRVDEPASAWLHRGMTSQDVLDTAMMLLLRDVLDRVIDEHRAQITALSTLAERHAGTAMVGRTVTQHAVPTTFGAVAAGWLDGLVDAAELAVQVRSRLPAQMGGAVGTLAATTEIAALADHTDPAASAMAVASGAASILGLHARRPWHTARGPVTRTGDALVSCTDAWGHIATDVAILSRTEIAELAEPTASGRGGSSTMPNKRNPVLSVLIRRAALTMPALGSTLHTASAMAGDQRPDGSWHAEWSTLATLGRRAVVAGSQTTELLQGLHVDVGRMADTLATATEGVLAERRSIGALLEASVDGDPTTYAGATRAIVAGAVHRAHHFLGDDA